MSLRIYVVRILLLNHNGGMQNKKGRTITFCVDESVAEGATGNAGNDQVNCYQTVIKGWESALHTTERT